MDRKKTILQNGLAGLLSQGITILFTFVTRSLFIKYIGVELLGINSTFASLVSTLSLAELGFQSAITFSLYKPLYDENRSEINDIMNIFKLVYRCIGILFIAAAFLILPFLKYIITDVEVDLDIYIYFLLQAAASTCTYFLAYKRALLYADQKEYISKIIDLSISVIFNILQCITLILKQNYSIYLILKILQVYMSNLIVYLYCTNTYHFLRKTKINRTKLSEIWKNTKNIFAGKFSGYIYSSTDNIIISAFISTVSVGYLTNYTTITKSLKSLIYNTLNPIIPSIGNYLIAEKEGKGREKAFLLYTHIRYLVAVFIVIPVIVLSDCFISIWVGEDMILSHILTILLAIDFYIDLVQSATIDFINGSGLFRVDKYIEILGAVSNIVLSFILVHYYGIVGVLVGTVISQIVFWFGRSYIVYFQCLKQSKQQYMKYWMKHIFYIVHFIIAYQLCNKLFKIIPLDTREIQFIIGGIFCEIVLFIYVSIMFRKLKEQKKLLKIIREIIFQE